MAVMVNAINDAANTVVKVFILITFWFKLGDVLVEKFCYPFM